MAAMYGMSPDSKLVTKGELAKLLFELDAKGVVPIGVTTITKVATKKLPAPYEQFSLPGYKDEKAGRTYFAKVGQIAGKLGLSYERQVNRARVKEGADPDFEAKKRDVYTQLSKAVKSHNETGMLYLTYFPSATAAAFETVYIGKKDGKFVIIDTEEVEPLLPAKPEGTGRQEVSEENEVVIRDLSFSSLVGITMDGGDYLHKDIDPTRYEMFQMIFAAKK